MPSLIDFIKEKEGITCIFNHIQSISKFPTVIQFIYSTQYTQNNDRELCNWLYFS